MRLPAGPRCPPDAPAPSCGSCMPWPRRSGCPRAARAWPSRNRKRRAEARRFCWSQGALARIAFAAANRAGALVVDLDFGSAHGVAHGFGALLDILVDDQLFLDPRLLADHRLLDALLGLDRALAEQRIAARVHGTIDRAALDIDALLAQVDLLLDGGL